MANGSALRLDTVTKAFGGLVAVDDLSFDLAEHEVLGLIGPNGSGKTTVLNLISGALKSGSGRILLYGEAISGAPANVIARMGIARTFQIVRMLPSLTVLENVCAGGVFGHGNRWGGELDAFARAQLKRVGLEGSPPCRRSPTSIRNASSSPARSRRSPRSCCSTNGSPG